MADRVVPGPVESSAHIREAVCIQTRKIFDSCRDKDCIEDLRVFPTVSSQPYIENAFSIRPKSAELLYARVNVEEMSFNRGFYTVDVTYFYRITGETFPGGNQVTGLSVFDKRVMLFGSEGSVKSFSSATAGVSAGAGSPIAVVESVDPIALSMRIADAECLQTPDLEPFTIPPEIFAAFQEELILTDTARRLYVTLGQFSMIRLERDTQLLIPAYDYCMPDKECESTCGDDPCALFGKIRFPVEEFFPPDTVDDPKDYRSLL
ncbi:MAG: hypothetical protein UEE32_06645 [Oscillospiraceae bacterium]|nr:hypothetical protein [Oscillospiraceae bacterium]